MEKITIFSSENILLYFYELLDASSAISFIRIRCALRSTAGLCWLRHLRIVWIEKMFRYNNRLPFSRKYFTW